MLSSKVFAVFTCPAGHDPHRSRNVRHEIKDGNIISVCKKCGAEMVKGISTTV